jgi:hypothetical protein
VVKKIGGQKIMIRSDLYVMIAKARRIVKGNGDYRQGLSGVWRSTSFYTATFSLIASLGAFTRSCLVPRYHSVVWTDAWPSSS